MSTDNQRKAGGMANPTPMYETNLRQSEQLAPRNADQVRKEIEAKALKEMLSRRLKLFPDRKDGFPKFEEIYDLAWNDALDWADGAHTFLSRGRDIGRAEGWAECIAFLETDPGQGSTLLTDELIDEAKCRGIKTGYKI